MSTEPLVSIVTPTYNRSDLIGDTIRSVVAQTYQNWEMLIVDNGSTDDTRRVVESFPDARIRYFFQQGTGSPVGPRNRGFAEARGDIICFLDSDDLWLPDKLARQVPCFKNHPKLGLLFADCFLVNGRGEVYGRHWDASRPARGRILAALLRHNFIPALTVAIPRHVLEEVGNLDETYRIAHDLDLYLKIAARYDIDYVNAPLAKLSMHDAGLSRNHLLGRSEVLAITRRWCESQEDSALSHRQKRALLGWQYFRMGVEMMQHKDRQTVGQDYLRKAFRIRPVHPLYGLGWVASYLPAPWLGSLVAQVRLPSQPR